LKFFRFDKICYFLLTLFLVSVSTAWSGETDDSQTLEIFTIEETVVSTSRIPRPISRIAENVTVITEKQIAALNAHTLAEVLNTVPGFQLQEVRTPGSWTDFSLQGALNAHVLVLIDGIPQGNLLQGQADPARIAVQQIERVEIIKGAASAAWGQALGGVINVITKAPNNESALSGTVFSSIGERFTTDLHGEASGTAKGFGYYLSGGNVHSGGLLQNNGINNSNVFGKFTYDMPGNGSLTFGLDFRDSKRGLNETASTHDNTENQRTYSFLNLTYPVGNLMKLELVARLSQEENLTLWGDLIDGAVIPYREFHLRESTKGGSAKLSWGDGLANLVSGVEYEHAETRQWEVLSPDSPFITDRSWDRWGTYTNGAFSFGALTILPGIRFDHTGLSSDALSYTLGATYSLTEKTVLRSYYARGYSLPNAIWSNGPQKVQTVQAGAESTAVPYLWLKGTFFYNNTWNVEVIDANPDAPGATLRSQIKQGVEVEARTIPLYNISLSGGYTFTDARDKETGIRLHDVPEHGAKLALHYDNDRLGLRGIMTGNYVRWNADPGNGAKDHAFIWDLSLTQKVRPNSDLSPELFFSVHNLFDDSQYLNSNYKNAGRWLEGGVRFTF